MFNLKTIVTSYAKEVGFDLVRIASADDFAEDRAVTLQRLKSGLMDGLPWFNEARVLRGTSPQALLPGARSIICLGLNYFQNDLEGPNDEVPKGKVARYAWGRDYHKVVKKRMRDYVDGLRLRLGTEFAARWYIDDGPMLDRAAAHRSGLGWFGKNTNILTPSLGSWVFLGQVLTDLEIPPDAPLKKTCGDCVRCIDACPTGAIVGPYVIDNTRCISYLTIENRGEIPADLRPLMGDWVFGCDICQDVCPVNRKAVPSDPAQWERDSGPNTSQTVRVQIPSSPDLKTGTGVKGGERGAFNTKTGSQGIHQKAQSSTSRSAGAIETLDLIELLEMSEEDFRDRFRDSPIRRAKRFGLQRNACVALGNRGDPVAIPALRRALVEGEPLVRGHAAWALGRIGAAHAHSALEDAKAQESDGWVLQEITDALNGLRSQEPA